MSETVRKDMVKASCPVCGELLQEASIAQSVQVCPCCGNTIVVSIKNGRSTVFVSRREEKDREVMVGTRLMSYYTKLKKSEIN